MRYPKIFFIAIAVATSIGFVACKKAEPMPGNPTPLAIVPVVPAAVAGTRAQLTADSMFLYSKELYYWQADLPTYSVFNPRQYTNTDAELFAISQISINPNTSKPYEFVENRSEPKYSYIDYGANGGKKSALKSDVNGSATDYGFSATYNTQTDLRVKYVYPNSPADKAGLVKGFRITAVNGRNDLTATSSNLTFLNSALFGDNPSVDIKFEDLNGTSKTVTITRTTYTINPILHTQVYTIGSKKVGYFVFNTYTSNATAAINAAFSNFASKGVTEMIIDLRYNGGGFVSTATQLVNLLAPVGQNGNTMFTFYYSKYLQDLSIKSNADKKLSILAKQPLEDLQGNIQLNAGAVNGKFNTLADLNFSPTSDNIEKFETSRSINPSRIYFLVSGSTASASELTINNLRAVTDVKIIGKTTYGKPVGFFPIHIDKFDMYIPNFETKNQKDVGGYYAGLTVDKDSFEDPTKNWGDSTETLLSYALNYAKSGNFNIAPSKSGSLASQSSRMAAKLTSEELRAISFSLDQNAFQGMIRDRKR